MPSSREILTRQNPSIIHSHARDDRSDGSTESEVFNGAYDEVVFTEEHPFTIQECM